MLKVILFSPNGYVGSGIRKKLMQQNDIEILEITRKTNLDIVEGYYDIMIYSASVTSERKADAEQYIRDNALCAVTMTEFCRKHLVKKIIYLSSDEIYGQLCTNQVTEETIMCSPNIYATTKYLAEKVIMDSGIAYYILRLPGVVGGRWGNGFVYRLINAISRNEKVFLYHADNDFNNVVDIDLYSSKYLRIHLFNNVVDIDDLIDFIMILIYEGDYLNSEVFLLGNINKIKLLDMAEYIREIVHSNSEIICMEHCNGRYFTLDVGKAIRYGYHSKSIKQIIDELCQYK